MANNYKAQKFYKLKDAFKYYYIYELFI